MRKVITTIPFLLCFAICSGCATIVSDKETFTQIDSFPSKAECVVEGKNYKQIITTPANLTLPAKAAPIAISCNIDGYHTGIERIDTKMDGWTFGNILFGGVIGVIVDASTKAGHKFPENVVVTLYRKTFTTQEELDAWYDKQEKDINDKIDLQISENKTKSDTETAEKKNKKLEVLREEQLEKVKNLRSSSAVITPSVCPKGQEKTVVK